VTINAEKTADDDVASAPAVRVDAMSVRYGALTALKDFDFVAEAGQVTAVIGPNGSGKTTFLNALTGAVPYQTGRVAINGLDVSHATPGRLHKLGVSRTFQNLDLMDDLSVESNVRLGATSRSHATLLEAALLAPRTISENRQRRQSAGAAMRLLGIERHSRTLVAELSYGLRRRVEVARALASSARILLLDEPTAGMGPNESNEFSQLVGHLRDELGLAVVMIEHDMSVVRSVADVTYVLSAGVTIAHGKPANVLDDPNVKRVYLGSFEVDNA